MVIADQPAGRPAYCVRRSTLDPWLPDTAEEAGAELRFRRRVIDLVRSDERVTGVVARGANGPVTLHADLVVGADGRHSTIAALTRAPEYLATESSRAGYFAYYRAPEVWPNDWDATLEHLGTDLRYVFRCDGDEVLLTYVGERSRVTAWPRERREEEFARALAGSPSTEVLARGRSPLRPLIGMLDGRFFYRQPVGPGYALVGDASPATASSPRFALCHSQSRSRRRELAVRLAITRCRSPNERNVAGVTGGKAARFEGAYSSSARACPPACHIPSARR